MKKFIERLVEIGKHLLKVCAAIIGIGIIFSLPVNPYALMSSSIDTLIATVLIIVFVVIPYSVYVWYNIIEWLDNVRGKNNSKEDKENEEDEDIDEEE